MEPLTIVDEALLWQQLELEQVSWGWVAQLLGVYISEARMRYEAFLAHHHAQSAGEVRQQQLRAWFDQQRKDTPHAAP